MNVSNIRRHAVHVAPLFLALALLVPTAGCGVGEYERRLKLTRDNGWPKDEPVVTQEVAPEEEVPEGEATQDEAAAPAQDLDERLRQLRGKQVEGGQILK